MTALAGQGLCKKRVSCAAAAAAPVAVLLPLLLSLIILGNRQATWSLATASYMQQREGVPMNTEYGRRVWSVSTGTVATHHSR